MRLPDASKCGMLNCNMRPASVSNRTSSPWRRLARSRRRKAGFLPWLVLGLGLISAIVLGVIGIRTDGFGFNTHTEWIHFQKSLSELDEPLYFESFVPANIPNEANLFHTPLFAPLLKQNPAPPPESLLSKVIHPGKGIVVASLLDASSDGKDRATLDAIASRLVTAGVTNPQTDYLLPGDRILAGFAELGFDFDPIHAALNHTSARFPNDYTRVAQPALPHLPFIEAMGDWLAIRAVASISTGNTTAAATDLLLVANLADTTASEPYLESQQMRRKLLEIFCSGVSTGLNRDTWSKQEIDQFRTVLNQAHPISDLLLAIRAERARLNTAIEQVLTGHPSDAPELIQTWLGAPAESFQKRQLRTTQVIVNTAIQQFIDSIQSESTTNVIQPETPEAQQVLELPISARERLATWEQEREIFKKTAQHLMETEIACTQK